MVKVGIGVLLGQSSLLSADIAVRICGSEYLGRVPIRPALDCAIEHGDDVHQEQNAADDVAALAISFRKRSVGDV